MNLGVADYDGLQTAVSYRGQLAHVCFGSYTLSRQPIPPSRTATASTRTKGISSRLGEANADPASSITASRVITIS